MNRKSKVYLEGHPVKNQTAASHVYQHMSSHYRRIINAKPAVDSSPPKSLKLLNQKHRRKHQPQVLSESCSTLSGFLENDKNRCLIERIAAEDKLNPLRLCEIPWNNGQRAYVNKTGKQILHSGKNVTVKQRPVSDLMESHWNQFESPSPFRPRILKSNVQSKVREMRVYHPPRRRINQCNKTAWESADHGDEQQSVCHDVCTCDEMNKREKEPSQTSSRDSAYNGGYSSTADSRSPTPREMNSFANSPNSKEAPTLTNATTQTEAKQHKTRSSSESSFRERRDDAVYTAFAHEIVKEVVQKGQFTDKALNRIFTRHLTVNMHRLDKTQMLEEIASLRERLGMASNCEEEVIDESFNHSSESADDSNCVSWTKFYKSVYCKNQTNIEIGSSVEAFEQLNTTYTIEENLDSQLLRSLSIRDSVDLSVEAASQKEPIIQKVLENSEDDDHSDIDELSFGAKTSDDDLYIVL